MTNPYEHAFPSQASPVGEAPRETAVWRCPCGEYETTVLHEDGEARIVSRRTEARQTPSREETAAVVEYHEFLPVAGHPDDDECTYRADGTDATYCGLPRYAHVPRTSEEPTEGEDEAHTKLISYVLNRGYDGSHEGLDAALAEFEQAIARQAAAPLGTRVSELERALAEADRWLELIRAVTAPKSGYIDAAERAYSLVNDALARPRSTESAPEEGSDE